MKKKEIRITGKRLANLFYLYEAKQLSILIDDYIGLVLAYDLGIYKRDSLESQNFSQFANLLHYLLDVIRLIRLDGIGIKTLHRGRRKLLHPEGFTKRQIKNPSLFLKDFFKLYPKPIARMHLYVWLEALFEFRGKDREKPQNKKLLQYENLFPFFLVLHELIGISHKLNKYL